MSKVVPDLKIKHLTPGSQLQFWMQVHTFCEYIHYLCFIWRYWNIMDNLWETTEIQTHCKIKILFANFTLTILNHGLVIPWSGPVSLTTLFADRGDRLAVFGALPSLHNAQGSRLTSCYTDFAWVVTSDLAGDCANCRHH